MIYHLSFYLKQYISGCNVFHYVSFRAVSALLTALCLSFLTWEWFINHSQRLFRAKTREHTPKNHEEKGHMPTMGGILIVAIVSLTCLLWSNLYDPHVWIMLTGLLLFGGIGFYDDWNKIRNRKGISARAKFVAQVTSGIILAFMLIASGTQTTVSLPFFKAVNPDIGWLFLPWVAFLVVGFSNAVNLTDGLDGLAIGSLIPTFGTFSLISYLAGHMLLAHYLHIPYAGTAELTVVGAALVGASLGFLWYNAYPAQIFMGDVGALSLGAALAVMAIMAKQELLLLIAGGLFVMETASVMLQVASFKYRGRRIFKMAPIHHHFELKGWQESKITVRFAIISIVLCLITLITLKIR
jgi:phospho-N-acetylmuramoyl-pentapeptide-transferase